MKSIALPPPPSLRNFRRSFASDVLAHNSGCILTTGVVIDVAKEGMLRMSYRAFAIDLDGTLLVGEHVPAENILALRAAGPTDRLNDAPAAGNR